MTSAYDCDVVLPCCTAAKPPATTWPRAELDTASSVKTSRLMPCKVKGPGRKQCKHLLRGCESGLEKQYSSEVFPDISRRCFISFENVPNIFRLLERTFCVFMELFQVSSIHLPFGSVWIILECLRMCECIFRCCVQYLQPKKQHASFHRELAACITLFYVIYSTLFHFQRINLQHLCTTHAIIYTNMTFQRRYGVEKCRANQALVWCMRSPGDWAKPPDVANTWCKNHAVQRCHLIHDNSWPTISGQFQTPSLALFYMF